MQHRWHWQQPCKMGTPHICFYSTEIQQSKYNILCIQICRINVNAKSIVCSYVCVCVNDQKRVALTTVLQFQTYTSTLFIHIERKVVKPKIERSLKVESTLTAANPYAKSNVQEAHIATPPPSHIAYKFNKYIAAFDFGQFTKSDVDWDLAIVTLCVTFLDEYFLFRGANRFAPLAQKKPRSFSNVRQPKYRFFIAPLLYDFIDVSFLSFP